MEACNYEMSRGGCGLANEHPGGFSPVGGGVTLELPFMCDIGCCCQQKVGGAAAIAGLVLMESERRAGKHALHLMDPPRERSSAAPLSAHIAERPTTPTV